MSASPKTSPASEVKAEQACKEASNQLTGPAPSNTFLCQNTLEGSQYINIKSLSASSRSKTELQRGEHSEHVPCGRSSCPATKQQDSSLANNIELFLTKRRELLCLSDSNVSKSRRKHLDRQKQCESSWHNHSSGEGETRKQLARNAETGCEDPFISNSDKGIKQVPEVSLQEAKRKGDSISGNVTAFLPGRSCSSPARFLECCLAAESGAKDLFNIQYLKGDTAMAANKHGDGILDDDQCNSLEKRGHSPQSCPETSEAPLMCKGACSNCCNVKWVSEGSLKTKKKNACGDVRTSDSGIHNEVDCCRICQEDGTYEKLISPCYCSGTVGFMHMSCLETWLGLNGRTACELCLFPFPVVKIHPNIWQFFSRPLANMDFASLLCDVACFCVLTPLLIASTYLCSIGVSHYEEVGKTGSVFAIVTLMVSLIAVYISWAVLAILYHRRVFLTWREKTARIQMWTDKTSPGLSPKKIPEDHNVTDDATNSGNTPLTSRRQSGMSLFLKPMLWYSYRFRSQKSEPSLPFVHGVNFNSNRREQLKFKKIQARRAEVAQRIKANKLALMSKFSSSIANSDV
ncbi:hypothetical protein BgiMline_001176 [Biomphalaria glabrata]|nr:E3 ubiquitin-protein ligase MARCH8-like [Biomphalaria glabrata]